MTIEERIKKNNERIEEMKDYVCKCERGYYHDNRTCEAEKHWIEDFEQQNKWLKELQAHREAWGKVRSELWMEGVNMTGEYQGVWVRYRDIERVIDTNRPKEGDTE